MYLSSHVSIPFQIFFLLVFFAISAIAQNLIPNGDFEFGLLPCDNTGTYGVDLVDDWYAIDGGFRYIRSECGPVLHFESMPSHSGNGHIMMGGTAWVNGTLTSSFVGIDFSEPLEAGETYYFSMQAKSRGIRHIEEPLVQDCEINPDRDVSVFIGLPDQSFEIIKENGKHVPIRVKYGEDYPAISLDQQVIITSWETPWREYNSCFIASGGESKIGISGPNRSFREVPPCELISDEQLDTFSLQAFTINRIFHFFNYELDDIQLLKLPDRLEGQLIACPNQEYVVDLVQYLPDEDFYQQATFQWEDGSNESERILSGSGLYNIEVILPCKTLPLNLTVSTADCPTPFYIPTAFSPNDDGINDVFQPVFHSFYDLEDFELIIYSSWGSPLYHSMNHQEAWTGKKDGKRLNPGIYTWIMSYTYSGFASNEIHMGEVVLLR